MGNQYQNFSNPTIIPDQKFGWDLANQNTSQAINNIGSYLKDQQDKVQSLQIQQASDLSKAHVMASLYYPQVKPAVEQMMAQNPYSRRAFSQQMGQAGQQGGQMGGNPNMMGGMIGAPGTTPYGTGMLPTPTATSSTDTSQSGGSGAGMSMNPVSTGSTVTYGGMEPPKFSQSTVNPVGKQIEAAASSSGSALGKADVPGAVATGEAAAAYGSKMGGEQAQANVGAVRDNTQLNQMAMSLKNILDLHGQLSDRGLAGSGPNERFTEGIYNNIPNIPALGNNNPQKALTNAQSQELLGRFTSSRNENMIRFQPQLSQQYGTPGSVRIMDSLVQLAGGEIPSLATPHAQAVGNVAGTVRSLYIFQKSTDAYSQHLQAIGAKMPQSPDDYIKGVTPYINQFKTSLSPEEDKELNNLTNKVVGKTQSPQQGSLNPVNNTKQQPAKQGSVPITPQIAQQIFNAAGRDPAKARLMAQNMGYKF